MIPKRRRDIVGTANLPPAKMPDLNKFPFTSSAREIVEEWAVLFAEFLNLNQQEKVEAWRFKVKPWQVLQ